MDKYMKKGDVIAYIRKEAKEAQSAFEELGGESGIIAEAFEDLANELEDFPTADMAEIIRGTIDGEQKYCRIPIRSKLAETIMDDTDTELSAEKILAMPHDKAAAVIDAIMRDWLYWLKRAGELWVLTREVEESE